MRALLFGIRQLRENRFHADIDGTWSIGQSITAGYLQLLAAIAGLANSSQLHPVAITTDFLIPATPGPAELMVERIHQGKATERYRVTMHQSGRPILVSSLTAANLVACSSDMDLSSPLELPPPDRCTRIEVDTLPAARLSILDHVELRLAPECVNVLRGSADGSFAFRGWVRMADGTDPDPLLCLALADAFPPVTFTIGRYDWTPPIQLSTYIRHLPSPGWLRAELRGRLLAGGWLDEECTIRDITGKVIAQSHQLGHVPRPAKKRHT